jgi:lipid II:glycine glycyltransferase (peptidoglycan interpeptide bridge formation enzyme)
VCNPIAKDQETFDRLLDGLIAHSRRTGWKYIEIRGGRAFLPHASVLAKHFVHTLELNSDEAEVIRRFKPNIRRNIHKAEKEGVTVTIENSLDAVASFYKLHCGTRRHHGLPPQPWSFFRKMHAHVIAAGKGFVALAGYQDRWIAGAVYALYRDQAIYKYGASERTSQHLRPNNLVMWEAIRWCCRNAVRTFSFGRTEPGNDGLLQFKRGWGSSESTLAYYRYDLRADRFVAETFQSNRLNGLFKRLPIPLLRMAGNLLYRHMG